MTATPPLKLMSYVHYDRLFVQDACIPVSFRQILDTKYGLKRWQIGEIASKIGQLYYHY